MAKTISSKSRSNLKKGNTIGVGRKPETDATREAKEIAKSFTPEGILMLIEESRNKENKLDSRIACINSVLDRGMGKPQQSVDAHVTGEIEIMVVVDDD